MATQVERYIAAVVAAGDVKAYRNDASIEPFLQFCTTQDQALFAMFDEYVREHKALPTPGLLKEEGWGLPAAEGAPGYWFKKLEEQHLKRGLAALANGIGENIKDTDPEELLVATMNAARDLARAKVGLQALDFRNGLAIMEKKWSDQATMALTLGWPTLDDMMAGARPGDRIDLIARPKLGKTYLMAFSALHVWAVQQRPVLFVSNEMVSEMIIERWSALATSTPAHILKTNQWPSFAKGMFAGKQSSNKVKQGFYDKMHVIEAGDVPLWVVGGNLGATVADVVDLAEKLGVCIVYDDGAYMHKVPQEPHPIRKVPFIVQDLKKDLATDLGIPVFASWQFTKDAAVSKLKQGEQPGLEHIAHSEDIGRLTSCAMGMFQAEGIETKLRRRVNILAGRSGEVGEFEVGWDFQRMDLSEITEEHPLYQPEYLEIA